MPASTTCRNYPYPVDTDPVDVAGDFADLATAIDADVCGIADDLTDAQGDIAALTAALTLQIDTLRNEMRAQGTRNFYRFVPPAPALGAGGTWTTIAVIGQIDVPSWASRIDLDVSIGGYKFQTPSADLIYHCRASVSVVAGAANALMPAAPGAAADPRHVTFKTRLLGMPVGNNQNVLIQVSRITGTGVVMFDTGTIITASAVVIT